MLNPRPHILCIAAALALTAPAFAGPQQIIGSGPAKVNIIAAPHGGMVVIYTNRIVSSQYHEPFTVDLDGFAVSGAINSRNGDKPDDLVVYPPVGFFCDPCQITVNEGESGAVELYPEVGA